MPSVLKVGIKPRRDTNGIDFSFMISSVEDYKKITKNLEEKNYAKVKVPWTFYNKAFNVVKDVLPPSLKLSRNSHIILINAK